MEGEDEVLAMSCVALLNMGVLIRFSSPFLREPYVPFVTSAHSLM